MKKNLVLVVEDNQVMHRHLKIILNKYNFDCIFATNESQAMQLISKDIFVIIADIDLSDSRGDPKGGIILAEKLSNIGIKVPIVMISQTPKYYFTQYSDQEFSELKKKLNIYDILDRNEISFHQVLIENIKKIKKKWMINCG